MHEYLDPRVLIVGVPAWSGHSITAQKIVHLRNPVEMLVADLTGVDILDLCLFGMVYTHVYHGLWYPQGLCLELFNADIHHGWRHIDRHLERPCIKFFIARKQLNETPPNSLHPRLSLLLLIQDIPVVLLPSTAPQGVSIPHIHAQGLHGYLVYVWIALHLEDEVSFIVSHHLLNQVRYVEDGLTRIPGALVPLDWSVVYQSWL